MWVETVSLGNVARSTRSTRCPCRPAASRSASRRSGRRPRSRRTGFGHESASVRRRARAAALEELGRRSSGGSSPASSMTWSGQPWRAAAGLGDRDEWRGRGGPRSGSSARDPVSVSSGIGGAAYRASMGPIAACTRGRRRVRPRSGRTDPRRPSRFAGTVEVVRAELHEPLVERSRSARNRCIASPNRGSGSNGARPIVSTSTSWAEPLGWSIANPAAIAPPTTRPTSAGGAGLVCAIRSPSQRSSR